MPHDQFVFGHIMARTSYIVINLMRRWWWWWWWCLLYTRPTCL